MLFLNENHWDIQVFYSGVVHCFFLDAANYPLTQIHLNL